MRIRDRGGAITPAEGCMFAAVALFVLLLLGLLYIAFMRFGSPPPPSEAPPAVWAPPPGHEGAGGDAHVLAVAGADGAVPRGGAGG